MDFVYPTVEQVSLIKYYQSHSTFYSNISEMKLLHLFAVR